jgi:hypothetical protein
MLSVEAKMAYLFGYFTGVADLLLIAGNDRDHVVASISDMTTKILEELGFTFDTAFSNDLKKFSNDQNVIMGEILKQLRYNAK